MRLPALALLTALAALPAGAVELSLPVDCALGQTCHIQQYVDRDPGEGAADYTCGPLSYDGHKGTDFRLPDRAAMRAGVHVLAAAPGVVQGLRDGMPDIAQGEPGAPDLAGRDCGNGVLLRHEDGWSTQYCHLAEGSLAVSKGAQVARGAVLGRIGLSGNSQFPHLHLTVRDPQGRVVDPFDGRAQDESCRFAEQGGLWASGLELPYEGGGALAAGFWDGVPDYAAVRNGTAARAHLSAGAPAIVLWAHFYGVREGDVIATRLADPSGRTVAEDSYRMPKTRATQFRAVGMRNRDRLAEGRWQGVAELRRGDEVHDRIAVEVTVGR